MAAVIILTDLDWCVTTDQKYKRNTQTQDLWEELSHVSERSAIGEKSKRL